MTSNVIDKITTEKLSIVENIITSTDLNPLTTNIDYSPSSSVGIESTVMSVNSNNDDNIKTTLKMLNVNDISSSLQLFGWIDYVVFVLMLVVCAIIGIYFGFVEKNTKKAKRNLEKRRGSEALDYLVGGRKMKVFPVSLSLVASFVSGISLLGTSTEVYVYGTQYVFSLLTIIISGFLSWYIFLPVFCNLQLTSTYEYFEHRFDSSVRLFSSILFTINMITWLPIVIHIAALSFNQVTGFDTYITTITLCIVCIFYTCIGGIKAVVWTDVLQGFIMFGSIVLVIIKGTMNVGGLGEVLRRNYETGRLETPEFTLNPAVRYSVLSVLIGSSFIWLQNTVCSQTMMQRFLSVPSVSSARRCLLYFSILVLLLMGSNCYNGLLIFATYHQCDPLSTKLAKADDQLVPLLVMDILGVYPGLPGLFVAGVLSASLSSLSTGLNSLTAVFLEDFIKPYRKTPLTENQIKIIMRLVVIIIGILSGTLVFLVEKMGLVMQLSMSTGAAINGPLLGLCILGTCLPWINGKSALTGGIVGCSCMMYICWNYQIANSSGELNYPKKPVTTEGCTYIFENVTKSSILNDKLSFEQEYHPYYHMSFLWFSPLGVLLTIVASNVATLIFGRCKQEDIDINLFAPCIRKFIKPRKYKSIQNVHEMETFNMTDNVEYVKEYFELRFDKRIRFFGSFLFAIGTMLWLPIVIYVPALAFNQVTGVNIHIITPVVCIVCIFYTCVGGLKAVVWTDVIQSFVMLGSIFLVIIKGTLDVGGLGEVFRRNYEAGRIEAPALTLDPNTRFSIFSVLIGATLFWTQAISCNQVMMQRFLAVPSLRSARKALFIFVAGVVLLLGCCSYNGLLIYATYHKCDPLSTKLAKAKDQLVPLLVMDILGIFPGLPGLFVAGVFSAALSSLSTGLNSMAAILLEDFLKPYSKPLTEKQTAIFMRSVVVVLGIICLGLVLVVERLGMVLQLSITLGSVTSGPLFGIFILGICFPWINGKSALTGGLTAFVLMAWICIKAQIAIATGELIFPVKPVFTTECSYSFSNHSQPTILQNTESSFYHMSFLWYVTLGAILTVIIGNFCTLIFGKMNPDDLDPCLFAPFIRKYIKARKYLSVQPDIKEMATVIRAFDIKKEITEKSLIK